MKLKLRDVEFETVLNSSGARGFFGAGRTSDEYQHHRLCERVFGLSYEHSTFVAKTTTTHPRIGNMPLDANLCPKECLPRCIVVKPLKGAVLNAVGLSGPGILDLLNQGRWQTRSVPFIISFMATGGGGAERRGPDWKEVAAQHVVARAAVLCVGGRGGKQGRIERGAVDGTLLGLEAQQRGEVR